MPLSWGVRKNKRISSQEYYIENFSMSGYQVYALSSELLKKLLPQYALFLDSISKINYMYTLSRDETKKKCINDKNHSFHGVIFKNAKEVSLLRLFC